MCNVDVDPSTRFPPPPLPAIRIIKLIKLFAFRAFFVHDIYRPAKCSGTKAVSLNVCVRSNASRFEATLGVGESVQEGEKRERGGEKGTRLQL